MCVVPIDVTRGSQRVGAERIAKSGFQKDRSIRVVWLVRG